MQINACGAETPAAPFPRHVGMSCCAFVAAGTGFRGAGGAGCKEGFDTYFHTYFIFIFDIKMGQDVRLLHCALLRLGSKDVETEGSFGAGG